MNYNVAKIDNAKQIFINNLAEDFKVLAHKKRIKILYLAYINENGICTKDIMEVLKIGKSTYDFHIKWLREKMFIKSMRLKNAEMLFFASPKAIKLLRNNKIID